MNTHWEDVGKWYSQVDRGQQTSATIRQEFRTSKMAEAGHEKMPLEDRTGRGVMSHCHDNSLLEDLSLR